jgi:hypothetical protein
VRDFFLGFLFAAVLAGGGYYQFLRHPEPDPCRACSTGTWCTAGVCVVANLPAQPVNRKRPGRRPGASPQTSGSSGTTVASNTGSNPATTGDSRPQAAEPVEPEAPPPPPPPTLRPEDKKTVSAGDKVTGTEIVNLAESGGSTHELTQEEIDAVIRSSESAIVKCIDDARGEARLEGRVTLVVRIQRSGKISGVRVESPAYLINHGLLSCVRGVVQNLTFPVSNQAQIASYPWSLY